MGSTSGIDDVGKLSLNFFYPATRFISLSSSRLRDSVYTSSSDDSTIFS
jgi:hypothetical protein